MEEKIFKYISKRSLDNQPIIFALVAETIQEDAEEYIGRRLTEDELNCFYWVMIDGDETTWRWREAIREAINEAINNNST